MPTTTVSKLQTSTAIRRSKRCGKDTELPIQDKYYTRFAEYFDIPNRSIRPGRESDGGGFN